jgi:hypothetical protein
MNEVNEINCNDIVNQYLDSQYKLEYHHELATNQLADISNVRMSFLQRLIFTIKNLIKWQ